MAEEVDKNKETSNFEGLITLTLNWVTWHTVI